MYKKINSKSKEIMAMLAEAKVYKKQGIVQARPAIEGEKIITKLINGVEETVNFAKNNDWVITNPSGEQYVIDKENFFSRYESTDTNGAYQAKGYCRAIKNPFGEPIEIMASWGSPQFGDENCLIADTCDEIGGNMSGEPYLIDIGAF